MKSNHGTKTFDNIRMSLAKASPDSLLQSDSKKRAKLLHSISTLHLGDLPGAQAVASNKSNTILDIEVSESGGLLIVLDNKGRLHAWDPINKMHLFTTEVDLTSIKEYLSTKPTAGEAYTRYYYSFKKRHNYNRERILKRLISMNRRAKALSSDEETQLHALMCSQAVRATLSRDEKHIFVFEGSKIFAYSSSNGEKISEVRFEYNDFAFDRVSCKVYIMRKDGLYTIDLLEGRILRRDMPPHDLEASLLTGAITLDSTCRYLTASFVDIDICKMPFGSLYNGEFYLTEQDISRTLVSKTVESMGRLRYGIELLKISRKSLFSLARMIKRAFKKTYIITWDLNKMSPVLVTTDEITMRPMQALTDPRNTPAYSPLFDTHYFMSNPGDEVVAHISGGTVVGVQNCRVPSVNFQLECVDDFIVILDNDKKTGHDVISACSQHDLSRKIIFDSGCDVYTNLRLNELFQAVVAGLSDGSLMLIDLVQIVDSTSRTLHKSGVEMLSTLTDCGYIASADSSNTVAVWRIAEQA